jgi:hypothetical protein
MLLYSRHRRIPGSVQIKSLREAFSGSTECLGEHSMSNSSLARDDLCGLRLTECSIVADAWDSWSKFSFRHQV